MKCFILILALLISACGHQTPPQDPITANCISTGFADVDGHILYANSEGVFTNGNPTTGTLNFCGQLYNGTMTLDGDIIVVKNGIPSSK